MSLPFPLPLWLPWWVPIAVLVPVLLYLIVFLIMPFSVFGLKGRLDMIDARLDEIQSEIRMLSLRLPERSVGPGEQDSGFATTRGSRPPLPPTTDLDGPRRGPPVRVPESPGYTPTLQDDDDRRSRQSGDGSLRRPPRRSGRAEPRLEWPR